MPLVDGLENLVRCPLSTGNAHAVIQAEPLLAGHEAKKVVADKAYNSWALSEMVHSMECMR